MEWGSFFVEGTPISQGRARSYIISGGVRKGRIGHYDPLGSKNFKEYVKYTAIGNGVPFIKGAISLNVVFYFPRPKSISRKKRPFHTTKPDTDNLIKAIKDALKGIAWIDDCYVVEEYARKEYVDSDENRPGVFVYYKEYTGGTMLK